MKTAAYTIFLVSSLGVSTAAHLDEAAATQGNPFPLASADVNFNFPVFQPFSQIPLLQCQKVGEKLNLSQSYYL